MPLQAKETSGQGKSCAMPPEVQAKEGRNDGTGIWQDIGKGKKVGAII
jgi:hypothetical protein